MFTRVASFALSLALASCALAQSVEPAAFVANNGNLEGSISSFRLNPDGTPTLRDKLITGSRPNTQLLHPGTYRLDSLGAGWTGTGINEFGEVCGSVSPDGTALLAGVSRGGQPFELLPLPEGMQTSRAYDINDAGVIVGAVCPNQYVITQPIAAVWRPGAGGYTVEVLGALPGLPYSAAYAINNIGDIVGASGHFGWNLTAGTLFGDDGPEALPDGMIGVDVNDGRVVLTGARLLNLNTGQIVETPLPPGNWQGFSGVALNNAGDFCGSIRGYSGCSTFPMRYRQGVGWEFLGGCATYTSATAINDRGDALLYYHTTTSGVHFDPEGYFQIGSLIDASQGEWYVQYSGANGINGSRQIVATAKDGANGPICAVLLTPIDTCPGDTNGDGVVDFADFSTVLAQYGQMGMGLAGDLNDDGVVDFADFSAVLAVYGSACP